MNPAGQPHAGSVKRLCLATCTVLSVCVRSRVSVPGVEQSGACAGRTNEVDRQVSPAVVGQGEPGLDVL